MFRRVRNYGAWAPYSQTIDIIVIHKRVYKFVEVRREQHIYKRLDAMLSIFLGGNI